MRGENSAFLHELKYGSTISVFGAGYQESRKVVSIASDDSVELDKPLSFTLLASASQNFIIRNRSGQGWLSNDGTSTSVFGVNTRLKRDVVPGYIVAVGAELRTVTSVLDDYHITVNTPFNAGNGGISESAWTAESCMSSTAMVKTYTEESPDLDPGCCGFKVSAEVHAGEFAYYKISPKHSNQDIRIILASADNQVDLFIRREVPPDHSHYDYRAEGGSSPWVIVVPHSALRCSSNSASCIPIFIGVKGLATEGYVAQYELSAYGEAHFPSFACSESQEKSLSDKCKELGFVQLGSSFFVHDESDAANTAAMRLTPQLKSQTGAVWWHNKLQLENGFETSFRFRISSSCAPSDLECTSGDGFALVLYGGSHPDQLGCGGRALGFANDAPNNCTSGISHSFAVEFDTWHNPELHDVNIRGSGKISTNASQSALHNYAHVAFFSMGEDSNSVSHTEQLAGTPAIPAIADGNLHQVRLVYIPGSTDIAPGRMFLYINDMQSFVLTAPIRLARSSSFCATNSKTDRCILDPFGNAFMGFTSATGDAGQIHDIRDWNFCEEPNCGR